ncbi:MAG TPA: propanediol/glycerol family dehydratase large subunit [Gaiella sp.]|jgi:propanediol dehydratase large subunit|nr:propanediol/glycerol family dehydratase large subunit [Gaiella sp.]
MRSRRFESRDRRPLRREVLVAPLPELGLVAADGPRDPAPELVVENGVVTRLDGRAAEELDVIDRFLVAHGLDLEVAAEAMALDDAELARMLVDVDVPRTELVRLSRGLTPAKLSRVVGLLDPVELMLALKKLRARRAPANQAHVTNLKESPALLAADAAEAARRGFAEIETTVGVARYAPLNALALLVGSQTGRPGVMTQCAVEEKRNLELAIRGLVTYAETLSVYGTEPVFVDGDDTPWSKAFLGSAYASRGVKVRFTSGTGSEALMGHAQGHSMLYLEARCLAAVRAAGSQGVQNGSISCVALVLSVPGGTRAILAENALAAWLDLEVASGNDAIASHSEIRKTAKLMGQFLPGTDFVTSGYSVMPRHDNTFGGGNFDADDIDEWLTVQRDWRVDAGIEPVPEDEVLAVRGRAARAVQAVFEELALPAVSEDEVAAATVGYDSADMPDRDRAADVEAADDLLARGVCGLDVALALDRRGFGDVGEAVLSMQRQRVSADYLQTAAVIDAEGLVHSAVNDPNVYSGPGTGYRLEGERWELLQALPSVVAPAELVADSPDGPGHLVDTRRAAKGSDPAEVVVAVGPAFADGIRATINDLDHRDVVEAVCAGVRDGGGVPRLIRVPGVADVAFIGHVGARLSGSGVALGIQSKGTAVIHRADLEPLDNLELFGMSPLYSLESYRAMGLNAAGYALGHRVGPVPTALDNFARAKLIVRTTLLHARETAAVRPGEPPVEVELAAVETAPA